MSNVKAKYYIELINSEEPTSIDLEATFDGLFVQDVEGLLNKGERKDIYVENFADKKGEKRYIGITPLYNPTKVMLKLVLFGDNMVKIYTDFLAYIAPLKSFYLYDNLRNAKAELYLSSAISPNDIYTEGAERIEVEIELINPNGDYTLIEQITL